MDTSKANLFIVAAPSGGGKTSLVKRLLAELEGIEISISHTTRDQRPGELDGRDYFFLEPKAFEAMVLQGEFLEHAEVFGRQYGTSKAQIESRLAAGIDVLLDIDWQGAAQIKSCFPEAVTVFVLPPSLLVLEQRLRNRKRDSETVIAERMAEAQAEMQHYAEFDYLIINDDFETATTELKAIVLSQRLCTARQAERQGKLLSILLQRQ